MKNDFYKIFALVCVPPSERANMAFVECCLFCGVGLWPEDEKRRKLPGVFSTLFGELWRETPLAWTVASGVVAATAADFSLALCMPCVHHLNRRRRWRRRGAGRALMLMDSLLAFLAHPFEVPVPDSRLLRRLSAALRATVKVRGVVYGNMYRRLIPAHMLPLLAAPLAHGEFVRRVREVEWSRRGAGSLIGSRTEMRTLRQLATPAEVDALAAVVLSGPAFSPAPSPVFTVGAGHAAGMQRSTVARCAVTSPTDVDAFEQAVRQALHIEHGATSPLHGAAYVLLRHRVLRRLGWPTGESREAFRGGEEPFRAFAAPNLLVVCEAGADGELTMRADVLYPELAPGKRPRGGEEELQFELEPPVCKFSPAFVEKVVSSCACGLTMPNCVTATCGAGCPNA